MSRFGEFWILPLYSKPGTEKFIVFCFGNFETISIIFSISSFLAFDVGTFSLFSIFVLEMRAARMFVPPMSNTRVIFIKRLLCIYICLML